MKITYTLRPRLYSKSGSSKGKLGNKRNFLGKVFFSAKFSIKLVFCIFYIFYLLLECDKFRARNNPFKYFTYHRTYTVKSIFVNFSLKVNFWRRLCYVIVLKFVFFSSFFFSVACRKGGVETRENISMSRSET